MRIRRITLAVLFLLTVLMIADVRYLGTDLSTNRQSSINFNVDRKAPDFAVEKQQTFVQPQNGFTALVVKGQLGTIELTSTTENTIKVSATIGAENQEVLDRLEVKETVSGSEVRYELTGQNGEGMAESGVSFVVEIPAGMEASIEQNFGSIKVDSFVGFLSLDSNFSDVDVRGLEGTATIQSNFSDVDLRQIAGPITLQDSFSTSTVELLPIDGGYDFDLEVNNGTLKQNAGLKVNRVEKRTLAQGPTGEGVHPVVIRSSFGTVTVKLD